MRTVPLLLLLGCYDGFPTEEGQLRLVPDDDLVVEPAGGFQPSNPVLRGAALCVDPACGDDATCPGDADVDACFETAADGSARVSAPTCIEAETSGEATWHWLPVDCPATADGYAPVADRVTLTVVEPAAVEARLDPWVERLAEQHAVPHGGWPRDWIQPAGEPFRVVETGHLRLPIRLEHPDHAEAVAWNDSRATIELVGGSGEVALDRPAPGIVDLTAEAGATAEVRLSLSGQPWKLADVMGVADEPAELELVVAYLEDEGHRSPLGARAVVRDRQGNPVYGSPVVFEVVEGALAVDPGGDLPGEDYAELRDACVPPSERAGARAATLEVRHGGLVDRLELAWDPMPSDLPDEGWVADEDCQEGKRGCGCASGAGPGPWSAVLAVLAMTRRRQGWSIHADA